MGEKLVIVPRKKSVGKRVLDIAITALMVISILASLVVPLIFLIPSAILVGVWYFVSYRSDLEYEYSYFEGDLRFARIKGKRRRKGLGKVSMDDVVVIAPKGSRSTYNYENDRNTAYRDLTSGRSDAVVYELVFKEERGMNRYEFEPDEEMLEAIRARYPRLVEIRNPEIAES